MRIRFFNTYETVSQFFRNLIPYLAQQNPQGVIEIVVSGAQYRIDRDVKRSVGDLPGVNVAQSPSFGLRPVRMLPKALVGLLYIVFAALYSLFAPRVDLNVFLTQPPLFTVWGYVLAKLRRQRYYCILQDLYPHLSVASGITRANRLLVVLARHVSEFSIRRADGVIVIGRCMADYVQRLGVKASRIHVIPNWVDEATVLPLPHSQNPFREILNRDSSFVVMYAGNLGYAQNFDDFLAVAERMSERADIAFVAIGEGSRQRDIENRVQQCANFILLPFQHHKYSLSEILSAGDLHFVGLKEGCHGLAVPSKSYGIMAVGRPILYQGHLDGEIARMVADNDIGAVVKQSDTEGLEKAILNYAGHSDLSRRQGQNARQLAETIYSCKAAHQRYAEVLGILR